MNPSKEFKVLNTTSLKEELIVTRSCAADSSSPKTSTAMEAQYTKHGSGFVSMDW